MIIKIDNKTNAVSQIPNTWKRIVPFKGVFSSIPCELIPAKNSIMLRGRKKPFIVASIFHHDKDCACVSLIKFFNSSPFKQCGAYFWDKKLEVPKKQTKNFFQRVKVTTLDDSFWMSPSICWTFFHTQFVWQNLCLEFSNSRLPRLPSHQKVTGTLRSNDATAMTTSLKKWICFFSVFIAIIPTGADPGFF